MSPKRRIVLMRVAILVALAVSAGLTAKHVGPGPDFCPLEEACEQAAESALGSIGGVPTSVIGLAAFGLFLIATLPSRDWSRRLLLPTGILASCAGIGLLAYQAFFLDAFCPLCVVADFSAIIAGGLAVGWGITPDFEARWLPEEAHSVRVAWALGGALAVISPFAIPKETHPAWEEVTPLADEAFELDGPATPTPTPVIEVAEAVPAPALPTPAPQPTVFPTPTQVETRPETMTAISATTARPISPEVSDPLTATPGGETTNAETAVAETADAETTTPQATAAETMPTEASVATDPTVAEPPPEQPKVVIVEYLNAYCKHCRKTYARLATVLSEVKVPVKQRRVYTWASNDYPLWARACAHAQTVGLEDELFHELLKSRSPSRSEVFAAARRAGLNLPALKEALANPEPPARLVRDRKLNRAARLKGLPTLDIGRRRFMGEQSVRSLRRAVRAAIRSAP